MIKHLRSVIVLTVICVIVAVLMAVTNEITYPIIEKNEAAATTESLLVVMPNGNNFNKVDISAHELPKTVTEVYLEKSGGYVIKLVTSGYASGMTILCGIDASGTITGAVCLGSSETLGYEKSYGNKVVGITFENLDTVDTVAGATMTTRGYLNAIKDAFAAFEILSEGNSDITHDNLKLKNESLKISKGVRSYEK